MSKDILTVVGHISFGVLFAVAICGAIAIHNYPQDYLELKQDNTFYKELIQQHIVLEEATFKIFEDYHVTLDLGTDAEEDFFKAAHKLDSLYKTQL